MKKSLFLSAAVVAFMSVSVSAAAFDFPTPDWGALLDEKTKMVKTDSLNMYVEAPSFAAPYYGARLEPKSGVYFGMVAEHSDVLVSKPSSYLTYFEQVASQTDIYYPANTYIENSNSVVTIGWTIDDLNSIDYDMIRQGLDNLNMYGKPMFIRFANEMNVSALGDDPEFYKSVFRKVADMVHEYPDFAVVWSPNDIGALDRPFEYYYPGGEYVDWVGISSYMKKYFMGLPGTAEKDKIYFMTDEYAWHTNAIKPIVKFMQDNNINKPLMISEGGVSYYNSFGEDNTAWAKPRLENMYWNLIMEYPQIKLINYFNKHIDGAPEYFDISDNADLIDVMNTAYGSGAYITEYGKEPDFVFAEAGSANQVLTDNNTASLYTSAYFAGHETVTVTYRLDGNWYHSANKIPYRCNLDISALSDGEHIIEISALDSSKTYTFYKSGQSISFGDAVTDEISVMVNGQKIYFDQQPVIENDRTLVPMRAIFEALGAVVEWDDSSKTVYAWRGADEIYITIGIASMKKNSEVLTLDVPAVIIGGRTMVPVRAVSEALGADVSWNAGARTVIIAD